MLVLWLFEEKLSQLWLLIDSALYSVVAWLYELFLKIAQTEIFNDAVYENFAQRVYIVLGIVMLFALAYNLLTAIVNPDNLTKGDKSMSKVATKLVTSLIIIGLLPTVFSYSRKLQNFILESNIIGTILFGTQEMDVTVREYDSSGVNYTEKVQTLTAAEVAQAQINAYGRIMSFTALNAFLNPENVKFQYDAGQYTVRNGYVNLGSVVGCIAGGAAGVGVTIFSLGWGVGVGAGIAAVSCAASGATVNWLGNQIDYKHYTWDQMKWSIINDGDFTQIISLANVLAEGAKSIDGTGDVEITYTPFVSSLCAGFLVYLLVSFCLDLGIRSVRLAFLQLIAPIPIFMRAMPGKATHFDKWVKKTISTYLEVFIRVFLMYMAVYFLSNLDLNISTWQGLWVKVVLIMGIIAFVKEAPKLIADITGIDSGNMKLGILPKLAAGGALAGAAAIGAGGKTLVNNAVATGYNIKKADGIGGKVGAGIYGIGSLIAGGASGAIRGGYGARSAKNISDTIKAGSAGAKAAIDAKGSRDQYRLINKGHVGQSQIHDALVSLGRWAGISNVDALKADQKILQDIFSKRKAAADAAETEVMKQAQERLASAGREVTSALTGEIYKNLSDLDNVIDLMKSKGTDAHGHSLDPATLSKHLTELQNLRVKLKDNLVDDYLDGYDKSGTARDISNITGPVRTNLAEFNTLLKNNMNVVSSYLSKTDLSDHDVIDQKEALEKYITATQNKKMDEILSDASISMSSIASNAKKLVGRSSGNLGTQIGDILQKENANNAKK